LSLAVSDPLTLKFVIALATTAAVGGLVPTLIDAQGGAVALSLQAWSAASCLVVSRQLRPRRPIPILTALDTLPRLMAAILIPLPLMDRSTGTGLPRTTVQVLCSQPTPMLYRMRSAAAIGLSTGPDMVG
jgi:hypothetical protein